jgi:hypothetical protein
MEHNVAAPEDIIPTDDKTPTEESVDMEQNVAAPEDIIPTDDKTATVETGDEVGGEEKSVQVNTGDAVRGKEISVNEEDNTASRLCSGKAVTRSTNTGKQPPKLTVREFFRRKAEAAEAERKKKNSKGGKRNAAVASGRKRAASKSVSSGSSSSSSDSSSVSNSFLSHLFWICSTLMISPTESCCYIMYPKFAFISHFVSFHKLFPFLIW